MSSIARVRELNDAFRIAGPRAGAWVTTAGVSDLGREFIQEAVEAVRAFTDFSPDNDPHGEHDFGSIELSGERLFWKIDYYDLSLRAGSEDPSDPAITRRVITIMLASEY